MILDSVMSLSTIFCAVSHLQVQVSAVFLSATGMLSSAQNKVKLTVGRQYDENLTEAWTLFIGLCLWKGVAVDTLLLLSATEAASRGESCLGRLGKL